MLLLRSHYRNAFKRNPFGENRILSFANTPDELPADSAFAPKNGPIDLSVPASEPAAIDATRSSAQQAVVSALNAVPQQSTAPAPDPQLAHQTSGTQHPNTASEADKHKSAEEIANRCEAMTHKINNLNEQCSTILKVLRKKSDPTATAKREEIELFLEQLQTQRGVLLRATEAAENIHRWQSGRTPPSEYVEWLQTYRLGASNDQENKTEERVSRAQKFIQDTAGKTECTDQEFADMTTATLWNDGPVYNNASTKGVAIQKINDIVETQKELADIGGFLDSLEAVFAKKNENSQKTIEENIENLFNTCLQCEAEMNEGKRQVLNIQLYSIMDLYYGAQNWWESYRECFTDAAVIREGKIQNTVAGMFKYMPYGEEAAKKSTKKLDGQHREAKGKYREELDEAKPKFLTLFGEDGEFSQYAHGYYPDYLMAIIEYGADHGWLYELRDKLSVNGVSIINILPSHWDPNRRAIYLDSLIGQNEDGFKKEVEGTAKDKEKYDSKYDFLTKELDGYLNDINIGAAVGIMSALYARAIDGNEGPHIATHFFRALRENANLRKYMTSTLLQKIARVSMGKGFFTMSNIWSDRGQLSKISKTPEKPIDMKHAGALAKAIQIAEEKIIAASGLTYTTPKEIERLDNLVATILSGKVVTFPNGNMISIWERDFIFYRDEQLNTVHAFAESGSVKDTDNDYFGSDDSELLLVSGKFVSGIFRTTSTGTWESPEKASNFVGKIKNQYEQLIQAYPDIDLESDAHPATIFRKELKNKIQAAIQTNIARSDSIGTYNVQSGNKEVMLKKDDGTDYKIPAVAWLQANKFIDLQAMGDNANKIIKLISDDVAFLENLQSSPPRPAPHTAPHPPHPPTQLAP